MTQIAKPKFHKLDVNGENYQSWRLNVELYLQGKGLVDALVEDEKATSKDKANALIFMRRHLHDSLKVQYLMVRDPLKLWNKLKERYDHMKSVVLPQSHYAWQHLKLQDFKSVADYNSTLFNIVTQLELCRMKMSDVQMLEKTFFTFHATNNVLQQQYRQKNFTKYSELISVLLTAEKTNELLLKNHDLSPTGSVAVLEAHANVNAQKSYGPSRGRGRKQGKGFRRGGGSSGAYNRNNPQNQNRDNDQKPTGKQYDICNRCGLSGYWTHTCLTQKYFVDLYQISLAHDGNKDEFNANEANAEAYNALVMHNSGDPNNTKGVKGSDFFKDLDGHINSGDEIGPNN